MNWSEQVNKKLSSCYLKVAELANFMWTLQCFIFLGHNVNSGQQDPNADLAPSTALGQTQPPKTNQEFQINRQK